MIILDLDAGNSYLKWRLSNSEKLVKTGILPNSAGVNAQLEKLQDALPIVPDRCRLSSVRSKAVTSKIIQALEAKAILMERAVVKNQFGGVWLKKIDTQKFGMDRWLALLAAKQLTGNKPLLVIDCGTAITFDFLSGSGVYEGGWIVPGLHSLLDTLVSKTDLLKKPADFNCARDRGFNTVDAMQYGVSTMTASMIEQAYNSWQTPGSLLLCGGDAAALTKIVNVPHSYHDNLVLDGLPVALPCGASSVR